MCACVECVECIVENKQYLIQCSDTIVLCGFSKDRLSYILAFIITNYYKYNTSSAV